MKAFDSSFLSLSLSLTKISLCCTYLQFLMLKQSPVMFFDTYPPNITQIFTLFRAKTVTITLLSTQITLVICHSRFISSGRLLSQKNFSIKYSELLRGACKNVIDVGSLKMPNYLFAVMDGGRRKLLCFEQVGEHMMGLELHLPIPINNYTI